MRNVIGYFRNKTRVLCYVCFFIIGGVQAQPGTIPQFPEWMIEKRIHVLNYQTPILLNYNPSVQAYIDVYTVKRRKHLANIISRSKLYFPLFEEYLDKYNLPLELKYLAVIESALDPRAKSTSGAMGLWQFLYHAGSMFNLNVSTYMDQRCDPVLATEAACQYLEYLYRIFNDWQLALAAYNGGPGVVEKAIKRSGGIRDYWQLRPYLPDQVKGYVPAFIAANYVMHYHANYDIEVQAPKYSYRDLDTVMVQQSLTFQHISDVVGISMDDLTFLNPVFIKQTIPVGDKPVRLLLPIKYITAFVQNEALLYQMPERKKTPKESAFSEKTVHIVAKGEYFHKIAIQHGCTINDILKWNGITSRNLHPGQELIIWKQKNPQKFFFIKDEIDNLAERK
ncbi:LysM domain-containing protein [Saccharicrinis carchari]|uniref:LysM domain-containing protein n=1 Tax=Saccharicrinis carchari TaxID=1168039 RepID=A0A521D376_SACCC|nr:lytic transglycosylase domain-containing protein [Saccharicrinis carchari]SMO66156.1 LysM domain-containing protein [Saccharicrinis carchari]